MVIPGACDQQLAAFCAQHGTEALAAVWERASETAMLKEITGSGLARSTWFQHGRPYESQMEPRPEMQDHPDSRGLRAALASCGVPVERVFGESAVTILELRYQPEA